MFFQKCVLENIYLKVYTSLTDENWIFFTIYYCHFSGIVLNQKNTNHADFLVLDWKFSKHRNTLCIISYFAKYFQHHNAALYLFQRLNKRK